MHSISKERIAFVTVGSTLFDDLISAVANDVEVLLALRSLRFSELRVQCGAGAIPGGFTRTNVEATEEHWIGNRCGLKVCIFRYKKDLKEEMQRAHLIIGHAGAGTVMEALELGKPLLVVINLALMNNHQMELAEKLAADGHLLFSTGTSALAKTLLQTELFQLTPLPRANPQLFASFLDRLVNEDERG